jgi:hypothetical protein
MKQQDKENEPLRKKQTNDEFWEGILQSEMKRLADDKNNSHLVTVEDITFGTNSDDDDVPIVQTLSKQPSHLSLLATLATTAATSPKLRKKRAPKSLWTYVAVNGPTGVASNYWDINAPAERTTKRLAKEKLTALHQGEGNHEGRLLCIVMYTIMH